MFKIKLPADRADPDMTAVASAFGISMKDVHDGIATGRISRWIEVGTGDADDKPHQVFASASLGIRVDVDEHGSVQFIGKHEVASAVFESPDDTEHDRVPVPEPLATPLQYGPDTTRKSHIDALLDEALNESFPASDPIAISVPRPRARSDNE